MSEIGEKIYNQAVTVIISELGFVLYLKDSVEPLNMHYDTA